MDILTFWHLLKPPQPFTGLFFRGIVKHQRSVDNTSLPPRTRSQHLPPPQAQITTPPSPQAQVTTPPSPGTRSQHLPPPQSQVTTPPSLPPGHRSQHLPSPSWDQVTTPPYPRDYMQVGGMHPTGMHSCWYDLVNLPIIATFCVSVFWWWIIIQCKINVQVPKPHTNS